MHPDLHHQPGVKPWPASHRAAEPAIARASGPATDRAREALPWAPLVSVVINNYNYARFLPETLTCALAQTYPHLEVVVVDDGSTDGSVEIIRAFAMRDARVRPVLKANGGQASAFNAGVAAARGDVLCFLDADDLWDATKVERVVAAHAEHPFVQHNLEKEGRPLFAVSPNRFDAARLLKEYGYLYLFAPTSALSLTRALADRIFPIPEEGMRLCADLFVVFSACYLAGVHTIRDPLGVYRIHEANGWQGRPAPIVNDGPRTYFEVLEAVNRWLFARGLYPIPTFNDFLNERMMAEVLQIAPGGTYIVYGTGQMSDFVCHVIAMRGARVKAFADSCADRWGTERRGIPIVSPAQVPELAGPRDRVVVASVFVRDIVETLTAHGVEAERVLYPPFLFQTRRDG